MHYGLICLLAFSICTVGIPLRKMAKVDSVLKTPFKGSIGQKGIAAIFCPKKKAMTTIWGMQVKRHSLPFQAALIISNAGNYYFCSGALISPEFVLTSARCVKGASAVDVILGAHNITEDEPTEAIYRSSDITIHHLWRPANLVNDIALIKLPRPVTLSEKIAPIKLATNEPAPEDVLIMSGWGKTGASDSKGGRADVLKKTSLLIAPKTECSYQYWYLGTQKMSCIFPMDEGACNGDFGSPIVDPDFKKLYGISAYVAPGTCTRTDFGIFTSIFGHLDWIKFHSGISPVIKPPVFFL